MADEKLDWELKFDDLMSGPLGKINERLDAFDKALGKVGASDFDKALGRKAQAAEDKVAQALDGAKAKLRGAKADFAQAWRALLETPLGKRASAALSNSLASVGGKMRGAFSAMGGKAQGVMGWLGGIGGSISAKIGPATSRAGAMFAPLVARAQSAWSAMSAGLSRFGASAATVLTPFGAGIGKALGAVGNLASAIGSKLGPALSGLGKAGLAGAGVLIGAAGAMAAAATGIAMAAGQWALSGLRFKEDTLVSFKTMLGTEDAAARVFKQATKFAATTPFSSEEVVGGFQRFLIAGFKEDQLDQLMKAVGDVGANMGTAKMDQVITGLSQIKAKGKLQGEEMMQLAEAGVGQSAVFDALAKNLGISREQAQARVSSGQVTGDQGIAAVLEAIRSTQSGGQLGSAMQGKSKTITGLLSSIADIPSTLLFASDMDSVTEPIKRALKGVLDAFEEGRPLFVRAQKAFDRIGTAWGRAFGTIASTDSDGLIGKIIDGTESFFTALAPFAEGFFPQMMTELSKIFGMIGGSGSPEEIRKTGEETAKALGMLAGALIALGKAVAWVFDKLAAVFEWFGEKTSMLFGGGASDAAEQASREEFERQREAMKIYKAQKAGGDLVAGAQPASPQITTTVGQVVVQVAPGQENAGIAVANQIQGQMPQQLSNFATELGG